MYQTLNSINNLNICYLNNRNPRSCLSFSIPKNIKDQFYFYQSDPNNPLHCSK